MLARARVYNIQDAQDTIWSYSAQNEPGKSQYLTQKKKQLTDAKSEKTQILNYQTKILKQLLLTKLQVVSVNTFEINEKLECQ